MTEPDEYKKTICVLTEQECNEYGDCSICTVALDEERKEREDERRRLIPNISKTKQDVEFKINVFNTIAIFDTDISTEKIVEIFQFPNKIISPVPYDIRRFIVRWPQFVKFKNITSLGIPNELIEICDFLIAYYDHAIFMTAPKLTEQEFNDENYKKHLK